MTIEARSTTERVRRCLVINGLPISRQAFERDHAESPTHDFARWSARGLRLDRAWRAGIGRDLEWSASLLDEMERSSTGDWVKVDCVRDGTLESLTGSVGAYDSVVLVAHWKAHGVSTRDVSDAGSTAEEILETIFGGKDEDEERARTFLDTLRRDLSEQRGQGAPSIDTLVRSLNNAVHNPGYGDLWGETAVGRAPNVCRAANRDLLDRVLDRKIVPGNRVELRDGMHRAEAIAGAIPLDPGGTVDLTVCQSELLAMAIKSCAPDARCVQTVQSIEVGPRLALSATVLRLQKARGGDYAALLSEVLDELRDD
ncbi:MAG: hypothetical protein AAF430_09505 [Myxococcota bacterium]